MDELISDRAKYLALALLGLASIGGAFVLADGPPVETAPSAARQVAKVQPAAQAGPEMAAEPEAEASPVASAAASPVATGEVKAEGGDTPAQDEGWGGSG